jgi:hypothetical protein
MGEAPRRDVSCMNKVDRYRATLASLEDWEPYLLKESRLPGPRGNIELAQAVADEGNEPLFDRLLAHEPGIAPTNTPEEFLAFCGVLGLGRLLAEGRTDVLPRLRDLASDPRWRIREAVAMALQRLGPQGMDFLLDEMDSWSRGNEYERRAAAAGLCEPQLLSEEEHALRVLQILDRITEGIQQAEDRKTPGFKALRKGLGYCWSVAVAAQPKAGKSMMERWLHSDDADVRWAMKENLRKKRLAAADPEWTAQWRRSLGMA